MIEKKSTQFKINLMKKNHDRSPDKKGFSVALPKQLLSDIEQIAKEEHRSRNGQIEHFLAESVDRWQANQIKPQSQPLALVAEEHLKSKPSPATPNLSTHAATVPVKYPTGKSRRKKA
jgi:hypothetical protein